METYHAFVVERDSTVAAVADVEPRVRAIVERIGRINYVIACHRRGIDLQSARCIQLKYELAKLGVQS